MRLTRELADLVDDRSAAHRADSLHIEIGSQTTEFGSDLVGQFTSRHDDQNFLARKTGDLVYERYEKSRRLAGASIGDADHVGAQDNMRDGFILNGRRHQIFLGDDIGFEASVYIEVRECMLGLEDGLYLGHDRLVDEFGLIDLPGKSAASSAATSPSTAAMEAPASSSATTKTSLGRALTIVKFSGRTLYRRGGSKVCIHISVTLSLSADLAIIGEKYVGNTIYYSGAEVNDCCMIARRQQSSSIITKHVDNSLKITSLRNQNNSKPHRMRRKWNKVMQKTQSEYAQAGVDPAKIEPFKRRMVEAGKRTLRFPERRHVYLSEEVLHGHGAVYRYGGSHQDHMWCGTKEGLGNKNWMAEWMYQFGGSFMKMAFFGYTMMCNMRMAVNDALAQGGLPVVYEDEVASGDSDWFADDARAEAIANGAYEACREDGIALPAGESPSLRYLVKATLPVKSAPVMSGHITSIIAPGSHLITGRRLQAGDHILGATSSGLHANGISLIIKRALELPDQFLTKLPNGNTLGEEALTPTRSYVGLIESLLYAGVDIHALLPGTGDGVAKLTFDDRPFTYNIRSWVKVPDIFLFMRELGVSLMDCLTTFNWGVGYYIFVPAHEVDRIISLGKATGYEVVDLGTVEDGERKVIFGPEGDLPLYPKGN